MPGAAVWSPDGQRIAFGVNTGAPGESGIYVKSVNGGDEQLLLSSDGNQMSVIANRISVSDWSHDGRWLL